jgi:hypothetical protein
MAPRPLHLGPITTLSSIRKVRYSKMIGIWILFDALLIALFVLTHR